MAQHDEVAGELLASAAVVAMVHLEAVDMCGIK